MAAAAAVSLSMEEKREGIEKKLEEMRELEANQLVHLDEKKVKLERMRDEICADVAAIRAGNAAEKALCFYWQGRAWSTLIEFHKEAEEFLTKAIKLSPSFVPAWNELGSAYWKKHDLKAARNCFERALERAKNKDSLRKLSVVLRGLKADAAERVENIKESVKCAKSALALDLKDGESWYVLGTAYLSQCFSVSCDLALLESALKAYRHAEGRGLCTADLYFNRGQVLKFLQQFSAAAQDFKKAATLDVELPALEEAEGVQRLAHRCGQLASGRGSKKSRMAKARMKALLAEKPPKGRSVVSLCDLKEGANAGVALALRHIFPVSTSDIPLCLLVGDSNSEPCILALYNVTLAVLSDVKEDAVLHVLDPVLKVVQGEKKEENFRCVQVQNPKAILVEGKAFSSQSIAPSTLEIKRM